LYNLLHLVTHQFHHTCVKNLSDNTGFGYIKQAKASDVTVLSDMTGFRIRYFIVPRTGTPVFTRLLPEYTSFLSRVLNQPDHLSLDRVLSTVLKTGTLIFNSAAPRPLIATIACEVYNTTAVYNSSVKS